MAANLCAQLSPCLSQAKLPSPPFCLPSTCQRHSIHLLNYINKLHYYRVVSVTNQDCPGWLHILPTAYQDLGENSKQNATQDKYKWKYSSRKLSALLTRKATPDLAQNSVEGPSRVTIHVHSKGRPFSYPAPRGPQALLRCLAAQVLSKKKGPKLCPRPCSPELLCRAHSFPRRGFQMAPGGSSAKLHSLSKCCRRPVLPGKGKGDPHGSSPAAARLLPGENRVPTTCLHPHWKPLSSAFVSFTAPFYHASPVHMGGISCQMPTEERK